MPTVIATLKVKEDKLDEAKKALRELCAAVTDGSEPGTLVYQCHQQTDEPATFVFYEKYADDAAFKAHGKGLPAKSAGLAGVLAGAPQVVTLEEI